MNKVLQILGLVLFNTIGILILSLMPSLVDAVHERFSPTAQELGIVASLALAGGTAGVIAVLFASGRFSIRQFIMAGVLIMIGASMSVTFVEGLRSFTFLLFAVGLGGGFACGASLRAAAQFDNPDRVYGLMLIGQVVSGFLGFLLLPATIASVGLGGAFGIFALIGLLCLPLAIYMPSGIGGRSSGRSGNLGPTAIFVTCSLLALYLANSALWAYAGRIGAADRIAAGTIDHALADSMLSGLVGAIIATLWGRFFSLKSGIVTGTVLIAAATILFLPGNTASFFSAILLLNLSIMLLFPLYLAVLAGTSDGEHAVTWGTLAAYVGLMIGPAAGGALVVGERYDLMTGAALATIGVALFLAIVGIRNLGGSGVESEI